MAHLWVHHMPWWRCAHIRVCHWHRWSWDCAHGARLARRCAARTIVGPAELLAYSHAPGSVVCLARRRPLVDGDEVVLLVWWCGCRIFLSCTRQCVCSAAVALKLHLFAVRVMSRLAFRYARQISEFLRLCSWLLVGNHRCAVRMQLPLRHTVTNPCRSCIATYGAPFATEIALNFVSSRSFSALTLPDLPHMIQMINQCSMSSNTYRLFVAVLERFAGPDSRRGSVLESSRRAESARTVRTSS